MMIERNEQSAFSLAYMQHIYACAMVTATMQRVFTDMQKPMPDEVFKPF